MSDDNSSFVAAVPLALAAFVSGASRRLIVLAPAVPKELAEAIEERWRALGPERVTVTLDVDPEVYRLGYGDPESLVRLEQVGRELGGMLQRHPGIRVGLVLADDRVLVFAPTPELIGAGPQSQPGLNAVFVGPPPAALEEELGASDAGSRAQTIGLDKATTADIEDVQEDIARNPPQRFDVARRVRVFNAAFQFVELSIKGASIARRSVQIPTHLLGVADQKTRGQLRTALRIVPPGHELSGDTLQKLRRRIERDYLKPIPRFGQVLLRANKGRFEEDVELLRQRVEEFKQSVRAKLEAELKKRIGDLAAALLPRLREAPPEDWLLPAEEPARRETVERRLRIDLERAIGSVDYFLNDMEVLVLYKDVTYESLADPSFVEAARRAFPDLPQLHAEYDAARANEQVSGNPA